jgi:hypothetical protein
VDNQLGFQLMRLRAESTSARRRRRQAGLKSLVNPILATPAADRLVADSKVPRDVLHTPSRRHKIQDSLAKPRWITLAPHAVLPLL